MKFTLDWKESLVIFLVLVTVFTAAVWYPSMPDTMVTHWDADGVANGWGPKWLGLGIIPIIMVGMYAMLTVVPFIAVFQKNISKFYKYYENFKVVFTLFFFAIYVMSILVNRGIAVPVTGIVMAGVGVILYYSGVLMENSKRNYFIGLKTPWTLASDRVWDKSNKLGGMFFKLFGVLAIPVAIVGSSLLLMWMGLMLLSVVYLFAYSYLEFKKEKKRK